MKRKILGFAMAGLMAAGLLTGCGSSSDQTASQSSGSSSVSESSSSSETMSVTEARKQEADRKSLKVGFDANYPPYGYMDDDGEYTGFDLELAQEVCDIEGWELEKTPISWDSKDQMLDSGEIDCIWNGFTINGREDDYTWSEPYVNNQQVVVVKKDSGVSKLSDLKGKTVGVQTASAALSVLKDSQKDLADTFKDLVEFGDYNEAFSELEGGSLDALAIDVGVANYQIKKRGSDKYVALSENLNSEQYGVGFKKGNESLCAIINADLNTLYENGTVDRLAEKYDIADMICLGDSQNASGSSDSSAAEE